jgi:hypothetical protein
VTSPLRGVASSFSVSARWSTCVASTRCTCWVCSTSWPIGACVFLSRRKWFGNVACLGRLLSSWSQSGDRVLGGYRSAASTRWQLKVLLRTVGNLKSCCRHLYKSDQVNLCNTAGHHCCTNIRSYCLESAAAIMMAVGKTL